MPKFKAEPGHCLLSMSVAFRAYERTLADTPPSTFLLCRACNAGMDDKIGDALR